MRAGFSVRQGARLLGGYDDGPGLAAHRARFGELPALSLAELDAAAAAWGLRGRGGSGFPFWDKLRAVRGGARPTVVVNASEGEPVSFKDTALVLGRPHLVLDGALVTARALGAGEVHVVVGAERDGCADAMKAALAERRGRRRRHRHEPRVRVHTTDPGFVSGQSSAVLELLAGRPNLPVSTWTPAAVAGLRGRPTLLCNAETWAQVAARVLPGTAAAYPTTLLTWNGEQAPLVLEAVDGTPWAELLPEGTRQPLLVGGYHGHWAPPELLRRLRLDRDAMKAAGVPLGAGCVVPLAPGECPVTMTARVVAYLAAESAGRCGPCLNGLPALAAALGALAAGDADAARAQALLTRVTGRGACAHPDGTARLVGSLLARFPGEVEAHAAGGCGVRPADQQAVA